MARFDELKGQAVFYVFEHFTEKGFADIINTYDGSAGRSEHTDISLKLVVHPMLFELLDVRVSEPHPIGI